MTYVTLAWELGFVLLILNRRTRVITLWCGVAMHLAMAALLELGTFSAVMLVGYVAFADPARVRRFVPSLRKSSAVLDASL
jgi:hypothetical protein